MLPKDTGEVADLTSLVLKCSPGIFASLSKLHLRNCATASSLSLQLYDKLYCQHLDNSQRLEVC